MGAGIAVTVERAAPMRVADYVMRYLADRGVERVFVLTGNGAMYLNDALAQEGRITYYCARNEAAAPMMAEGYARLAHKLGVVSVTAGPGGTNAVAGLAEAWVDSAPIMVISGQAPRDQLPGPAARGVRSFGTAAVDIVPVVRPLTKYAATVTDPATIRFHLDQAYHLATTGRPGPVWLDLPMDVQYALVEPDELPGWSPEPVEHDDAVAAADRILAILARARRPLVIGGQGIRHGGATARFRQLVGRLRAPVVFSRLGQDLLPLSHPYNLGQAGRRGMRASKQVLADADVVLALGSRLAVQLAGPELEHFAPNATIVMVDVDPAELAHHAPRLDVPIRADVRAVLEALLERLREADLPDWEHWLRACQAHKTARPMVGPERRRDPIDLYYFMARLDALAEARDVFVTDAGSNYYVGGQVYRFELGQREITSGAYAAMGLSIPLAIGAAVARPEGRILAVTGDGSLELNIQELKTLAYYRFDVKLFVINNGGYVSMRNWQDQFFDGRRIGSDDDTGTEMLALEKVAAAFDLPYARIATVDEIDTALRTVLARPGPILVEVVTDPEQAIVQPFVDTALSS